MLGPLSVHRDGVPVALPRSRKVRALLGFLALTPEPVVRSRLCDLLWEVPNDPRGELRWCLSRLRSVLGPDEHRLTTQAPDQVLLDVSGCFVDAVAAQRALQGGVTRMETAQLAEVCRWFTGDLLGGLDVDGSAEFHGWLTAQRARYRTVEISLLQELVARTPRGSEEMFVHLDAWLQRAPFDLRPHEVMLDALAQIGRLRDAQEHFAKTVRLFDEQGVDASPLRETWRAVRDGIRRPTTPPTAEPRTQKPAVHGEERVGAAGRASARLVGRDREHASLSQMWSAVCEGQASLLLITGEAGIGKTSLANDFLAQAAAKGASTARAACYHADRPMAYAAVADWLRSPPFREVLDRLPAPQLSQLARVVPAILIDRPDVPPPAPLTESWQRGHFFEALARALLAAPQPLLAFIDDLQWCDQETIEWLHYLLHSEPKARVMFLAAARTEDFDTAHPVAAMLRDLRRSERGAEIALGPLSADDTASLAAKIADDRPESGRSDDTGPDPTRRTLYEKTHGNPLFIVEMVRAGLGGADEGALPAKVHAVIRTRFSQLSEGARETASLAAVVGRPFTLNLLTKASGSNEDAVAGAIDELWRRNLVQTLAGGAYDFSHGLLRDVCYTDLGPERRRSLHRRVALALGALHAEPDAASAHIAEHFERGGQLWEAVPHLERAASVAHHRFAEGEAIGFLERALGLLGAVAQDPSSAHGREREVTELRLLASLGRALMRTRGYAAPAVGQTFARARALSERVGEDSLRFAVLSGSFLHHVVGADLDVAHKMAAECLELGEKSGDPAILAGGRLALGSSLFHLGELARADEQFTAVAATGDVDAHPGVSYELGFGVDVFCGAYQSHTRWLLGDADGALECRRDAMARAEALAQPFSLAIALAYDAMLQQFRGDPELTWRQADLAAALCEKHGFSYYLSWTPILRGWARARLGAVAEGLAEMRQGYASFCATGARLRAPYYLALMAAVSRDAGDEDGAQRLTGESRAAAERTGERWRWKEAGK
jgi:DNA-binding SARP family transcriptional activator/predicted ATPase